MGFADDDKAIYLTIMDKAFIHTLDGLHHRNAKQLYGFARIMAIHPHQVEVFMEKQDFVGFELIINHAIQRLIAQSYDLAVANGMFQLFE